MSARPTSITSWTRLEARARDPEMRIALEARVRDPLWMLTRQWQLGELTGEDCGSPVAARVHATASRITRLATGTSAPRPIDLSAQPIECAIEAEAPVLDPHTAVEAA